MSGTDDTTPEELEADIARQREQIAATVDELQTQLQARARATAKLAAIAAGVALVGLVGLTVWRRRR